MYMIIKKHILNMSKYVGKIFLGPWIFAFQYAVETVLNSFVKWIQGIWISLIHSTSDTTQYITHFYSSFFLTRALTLSNGSNKNFFHPNFCHESEVRNFKTFFLNKSKYQETSICNMLNTNSSRIFFMFVVWFLSSGNPCFTRHIFTGQ